MAGTRKRVISTEKQEINDEIKRDLLDQLDENGMIGKFYEDLIEDYIEFVKLKNELQEDITKKGIRYKAMTGNGIMSDKANESVQNLVKVNAQMLKMLADLDLKQPKAVVDDDPL